jgi:hypothetical protein
MVSVTRYQKRLSGPLLDRIDIHVEVPRVEYDKLSDAGWGTFGRHRPGLTTSGGARSETPRNSASGP